MTLIKVSLTLLAGLLSASLLPLPFIAWYIAFALSAIFALSAYRESRDYQPDHPAHEFTRTLLLIALFALAGLRVASDPNSQSAGVHASHSVCSVSAAGADESARLNLLLRPICQLREMFSERILALYDEPENALVDGIVIGDESRIPRSLQSAFRITGTAHIVAISGANFTVLIWILMAFVRRVTARWWTVAALLPFILGYTLLTGGSAPIVRAAILSALTLVGMTVGQVKDGESSLAFSAAAMSFVSPSVLFDAGFQLSVTATLGILLWNRPLARSLEHGLSARVPEADHGRIRAIVDLANELILTSLSAQVLTTFVGASLFGEFSWVSLPCNAAIALLQTPLMIGGIVSLAVSYLSFDLGVLIARGTAVFPALTIRLVELFARIPGASRPFALTKAQCWLICFGIVIAWKTRARWFAYLLALRDDWNSGGKRDAAASIAMAVLFFATAAAWRSAAPNAGRLFGRAEIHVLERNGNFTLTARTKRGNEIRIHSGLETATLNGNALLGDGNGDTTLDALTGMDRTAVQEIQVGEMTITRLFSHVSGDALQFGTGRFSLLIPNGAPPSAFEARGVEWRGASLVLIRPLDGTAEWIRALSEAGAKEPWRVLPGWIDLKLSPAFSLSCDGKRYFYRNGAIEKKGGL